FLTLRQHLPSNVTNLSLSSIAASQCKEMTKFSCIHGNYHIASTGIRQYRSCILIGNLGILIECLLELIIPHKENLVDVDLIFLFIVHEVRLRIDVRISFRIPFLFQSGIIGHMLLILRNLNIVLITKELVCILTDKIAEQHKENSIPN